MKIERAAPPRVLISVITVTDSDPLRQEAKRLLNLTPAEGQEEIVLTALRIGEQDRQAGEALDQIDRDFLRTMLPLGTSHVE